MSEKLPMTRDQIEEEMGKCSIGAFSLPEHQVKAWVRFAEHILRIGTTELREENKRLRSGEFICKKCGLRKESDNFFKDGVPF